MSKEIKGNLWLWSPMQIVKKFLSTYIGHRDDDRKLCAAVWITQLTELGINKDHAVQIMKYYADGKLSSAESIRRSRQKLQEQYEGLRGSKYKQRQEHAKDIQKKINT